MVFRSVIVARIVPGSEGTVGDVFGYYDDRTRPQDLGVIGRSLLSLHDLYIHVIERNVDPKVSGKTRGLPAFQAIAEAIAPYVTPYPRNWKMPSDSVAKEFYSWVPPNGDDAAETGSDGGSQTIVVGRIEPGVEPEIARIFGKSDAGPLPAQTGVSGRWLYSNDDVYLHLLTRSQEASSPEAMRKAHGNPAFAQVMTELNPYIRPFRPEAWHSHADSVAKEFYRWRAKD